MSEEQVVDNTPQIQTPTDTPPAQENNFQMPEKFVGKSAEDIAKSYMELEKFKGSSSTPEATPQVAPEATPEQDPLQIKQEEPMTVDKVVDKFGQLFVENDNKLLPEHYEELEQLGYPKGVIDQYIRGQVAQVEAQQSQVHKVLGGESQTTEMFQWASENLSKTEIETMNQQLKDNPEVGAQMLKLRYDAEVPKSGQFLQGNGAPANHTDVFHSQEEVVQAMRHPEYNQGGAYDLMLKDKLQRSVRAGKIR